MFGDVDSQRALAEKRITEEQRKFTLSRVIFLALNNRIEPNVFCFAELGEAGPVAFEIFRASTLFDNLFDFFYMLGVRLRHCFYFAFPAHFIYSPTALYC